MFISVSIPRTDACALLPVRPGDGHKGTFGHVLSVAGSEGMAGAATLCARSALRAGAGLRLLEAMLHPFLGSALPVAQLEEGGMQVGQHCLC